jgi:hypothetical protein
MKLLHTLLSLLAHRAKHPKVGISPNKTSIIFVICCLFVFLVSPAVNCQKQPDSFNSCTATNVCVGERLEFKIKWSFIPAGTASMEVASIPPDIAVDANHFILKARTYPAIDLIYKFRERIDSYTNHSITRSIRYKKVQNGRTKRDINVAFDWDKHEASYKNFKEKLKPITIQDGTLDVLSAFYFIRTQKLIVGQTIERPITDGKKVVIGRLHVLKREKIRIKGRTIDTFKLQPELKGVKGVFEKSKHAKMYIWVTADNRKILVRLKSKVIVGSFVANLVNLEQL